MVINAASTEVRRIKLRRLIAGRRTPAQLPFLTSNTPLRASSQMPTAHTLFRRFPIRFTSRSRASNKRQSQLPLTFVTVGNRLTD